MVTTSPRRIHRRYVRNEATIDHLDLLRKSGEFPYER
jgi:hypothetical protein